MKKIAITTLSVLLLLISVAGIMYLTPSGQDALFKRAAHQVLSAEPKETNGIQVIICGSASPLGFDPNRAQACIAVITPEHFFLFDVGARAPLRIAQAQLPLARLDGVFLTHFHSDHISGLPDVALNSWVQGRNSPLPIFGAEGVSTVVDGFNQAYELDRSYRTAHHGSTLLPSRSGIMQPHTFKEGGIVWQDDLITVRSFTVAHPPIEPAVGYRIDYRDRSVVISGDTNVTESLFAVGQGADLLLHDALSHTLLEPMIELAQERMSSIMTDVIDYHANVEYLAAKASEAGIKKLALYHMVPVPSNPLMEKMFLRNTPSGIILTEDLQTFTLPPYEQTILVHEP